MTVWELLAYYWVIVGFVGFIIMLGAGMTLLCEDFFDKPSVEWMSLILARVSFLFYAWSLAGVTLDYFNKAITCLLCS